MCPLWDSMETMRPGPIGVADASAESLPLSRLRARTWKSYGTPLYSVVTVTRRASAPPATSVQLSGNSSSVCFR